MISEKLQKPEILPTPHYHPDDAKEDVHFHNINDNSSSLWNDILNTLVETSSNIGSSKNTNAACICVLMMWLNNFVRID